MSKYNTFMFKDYQFDIAAKTLQLHYSFDEQLNFNEIYKFDFDFVDYSEHQLDIALQSLFLMAGVSYYKTYLPQKIEFQMPISLDQASLNFFAKTYQKGLGEFFYTNHLNPNTPVQFPPSSAHAQPIEADDNNGLLIGIGGGKDSLLSVELLRDQPKIATWSVGHRTQLTPLVEKIGLPHYWVDRTIDPKLLELKNNPDAYNGHIPISAILACVGVIVTILTGYRDVVVSNESSASEPNLIYQGIPINHQYSKSLEFEKDFQQFLKCYYGESLRYYSFLRPLSELHIAKLFARVGFEKYKSVFSSCNRAFTQHSDHMFWCGECPKCAFTFLALTPFIDREKLEALFEGKNLLLDQKLEATYRQLLGIEGDKPLDCVGEVKESRAAMRLAQKIYPELSKYQFEIPKEYDYLALSSHSMPAELFVVFQAAINF